MISCNITVKWFLHNSKKQTCKTLIKRDYLSKKASIPTAVTIAYHVDCYSWSIVIYTMVLNVTFVCVMTTTEP